MRIVHNREESGNVHGTARWMSPLRALYPGVLEITTDTGTALYEVRCLVEESHVVGFRLNKVTGGKEAFYDIDIRTEPWQCDCPDATFHPERPGGCKHVLALRAALAVLKQ